MEDVNAMCERRRHSFQADIHNRQPSSGPVRAVHPKDRSTTDRPEIKAKVNNDTANKQLDIYHKSARVSDWQVKLVEIACYSLQNTDQWQFFVLSKLLLVAAEYFINS